MMKDEQKITPFSRNSSGARSTELLLPPLRRSRSTASPDDFEQLSCKSPESSCSVAAWKPRGHRVISRFSTLVRTFLTIIKIKSQIFVPTHGSTIQSSGRIVFGTLFGRRRGHVSFAVHSDRNRIKPILLLELEISTAALVEDISTGTGRIVLECPKIHSSPSSTTTLVCEQKWTMYCKGRKSGHARSRACSESDSHVMNTIRRVSVGAGVIPAAAAAEDGGGKCGGGAGSELVYMRAKFERVVGGCDTEAFYMLNPDSNGGPEFSIFLLRK